MEKKYIGCSGYYYNDWKEKFYPAGLAKSKWLQYYSTHFNTVEINNTFYKMPAENALRKWYNDTPANFIFTLKGYRFMTHIKKLHIDEIFKENLVEFQTKAHILKEKLGSVLWQFPHSVKINLSRLEAFFQLLDPSIQHVIEFRDIGWFNDEVYQLLTKYHIAFCMVSAPGDLSEEVRVTSDVAYLRFHGKSDWYRYEYSTEELEQWNVKLSQIQVKQFYAYFNNDFNANAVRNGLTFARIMENN